MSWTAAEAAALRGTSCGARLAGRGGASDELPSATSRAWRFCAAPLAITLNLPRGAAGRAAHARATALVAAYSFSLGGGGAHQALVPFWDALNHAHPEHASVRLHHDAQAGRLEMVVVRPVAAGAEVFNTYGALGTSELVRRYGFAPPGANPYDAAEVSGRAVVAAAAAAGVSYSELRLSVRLARQVGLLPRHARFRLPAAGEPPAVLLLALRVLCGSAGDSAGAAAALRRARAPPPPQQHAAQRVAAALAALASGAQRRLPCSAADAAAALARLPPPSRRTSLALRVCAAEHASLAALVRWAAQEATPAALLLRSGEDAAAERALWRRGVRAAAQRTLLAQRKRRPRPPQLTCPGVLRRLCLARAVRFRPPRSRRGPSVSVVDAAAGAAAAPLPPPQPRLRCCLDGACCGQRFGAAGPFALRAAQWR